MDGDGDLDVVGTYSHDLALWLENSNGDGSTWTEHDINTTDVEPGGITVCDFDHDGDLDVITNTRGENGALLWHENVSGNGSTWTPHTMLYGVQVAAVDVKDIDLDGDLDVGVAYETPLPNVERRLAWFENSAGDCSTWVLHELGFTTALPPAIHFQDIDHDGDLDVIFADNNQMKYRLNRGGQYATATTVSGPSELGDGMSSEFFEITVTHKGRSTDPDIYLVSFDLLFEVTAGSPLTTVQANSLIEVIRVYADDGSGSLEIGTDTLVADISTLNLKDGLADEGHLTVDLPLYSTPTLLTPGDSITYFVVLQLTSNASSQTPSSFMVSHVPELFAAKYYFTTGNTVVSEWSDSVTTSVTARTSHQIVVTADSGGSISPSGTVLVTDGGSQTFNISSDPAYQVQDVLVDGASQGILFAYTFTNVTTDHTLEAHFIPREYVINAAAGTGGSIDPAGSIIIGHGQNQGFIITPEEGYEILNVFVDGMSIGPVSSYNFSDVQAGHTIYAMFLWVGIPKDPSTITCELSSSEIVVGEPLTVSGSITPAPTGPATGLAVELVSPQGGTTRLEIDSHTDGQFSRAVPCGIVNWNGSWVVRTKWSGDVDLDGAVSSDQDMTVGRANTGITLDVTSSVIKLGDPISISGKLTPVPDCGEDLVNRSIMLIISGPNGWLDIQYVWTNDQWGHFVLEDYDSFSSLGDYIIRASFAGDGAHNPSTSLPATVKAVETAGYAVIVQGRVSSEEGLESHNKTTNNVYERLKERGLLEDDIYYLNYDVNQDGVDALTDKNSVQQAITVWARDKMNAKPANLYIVMVDHGINDVFYIHPDQITATDLAGWLDDLQAGLTGQAAGQEIAVFLGFCRAGSFIDDISGDNRIIIASAAADESSYKGPLDDDGIREGEYFISEFFKRASVGKTIKECFDTAAEHTHVFTHSDDVDPDGNGPYFDSAVQHPLIDDNGDGVGSHSAEARQGRDGWVADSTVIGVSSITGNDPGDVTITEVPYNIFLADGTTTVTLWARVDDDVRLRTIWAEVKPPDFSMVDPGGSGQVEMVLPRTVGLYSASESRYEWTDLGGFTAPGTYHVYYFAKDDLTGHVSPLMESIVYKAKPLGENNPPSSFSLISPGDGTEGLTTVILDWEDAVDPEGDSLTYTILLSKDDPGFSDPIRIERLGYSTHMVTEGDGLEDLATYYWKILAIDEYGESRESSETWIYHTNNTNPLASYITGHVYDASTADPVVLAQVIVNGTWTIFTGEGGYFLGGVTPGTYTVAVSADGYETAVVNAQLQEGQVNTVDVGLTPALDSDEDGIPNAVEDGSPCLKSDDPDTDDDGLLDGEEDLDRDGNWDEGETNPCLWDTDGDGMDDGWEVRYSLNPLVDDADDDDDDDGYTNLQEYKGGSDPTDPDSRPTRPMPFLMLLLIDE